ncbi:hypothetical protein CBM2592_B70055 [Cupriavidus taiwanensis]|nr:hypothetical protein CBM2588_B50055 [Cupriavidus taiwanensis]SOY72552.1 hypothetical protein CBM2592_B70055 [Cupriavidus taiwanensis]SOY96288.1 hypothetical protein CBM2591_B40090 [Cupriavidus taiwanensis]SPD56613.1 protein of unknown function [Cupriavidus taiwanensis]
MAARRSFQIPLANPAALAYYSPPRNTTRPLQGRRSKGCGVGREVGAARFAAPAAAKKFAETVDETKKALHNLVSLLQTTQRAERQSRMAKFFNKQTTDKCGRWVADAAVYGQ